MMMKSFLAMGLTLALAGQALALSATDPLDAYLQQVTGRPPQAIQAHVADSKSPAGDTLLFGLVQVPASMEAQDSTAFVFVARRGRDGALVELARSKPFGFWSAGGRHYVEIVQAPAADRFTLQINYTGACTAGHDVFRFAQKASAWVLAGRDSTRMHCSSDDQAPGDSRLERSANFLTGTVLQTQYERGKVKARDSWREAFPAFPVADFDPFSRAYGLR